MVRDRGWVSEEVQIGFLGAGWGSGKYPVGRLEDLIERADMGRMHLGERMQLDVCLSWSLVSLVLCHAPGTPLIERSGGEHS